MAKEFSIASPDQQDERLQALKSTFPDLFTEDGKIDFNRILGTLTEEKFTNIPEKEKLKRGERYQLDFAGKQEAYEKLNETSTDSLLPDASMSVNFNETENVIIEGDNLDALKILQHNYYGKVKCIYIDPPYNTGNDWFIYPDDYKDTRKKHLKKTGEMDALGNLITDDRWRENNRTSGSFHSNWLGMMLPRLHLAKKLLKRDGVIFISIDDNEVHNLRMMMNEIFGEENFIANFVWKKRSGTNDAKNFVSVDHEYVLVYSKNGFVRLNGLEKTFVAYSNPDNDERGDWTAGDLTCNKTALQRPNLYYPITDPATKIVYQCNPNRVWRTIREKMQEHIEAGKILFPKDGKGTPMYKRFKDEVLSDYQPISSILDTPLNSTATKEVRDLLGGQFFNFPKSVKFVKKLIEQCADDEGDIVLDFFAGSGTTAQAVIELNAEDEKNRKFILIQYPELVDNQSEAYQIGYRYISEITCERVRRAGKQIADKQAISLGFNKKTDVGFRFFRVIDSNFEHWDSNVTESEIVQRTLDFATPEKADATNEGLLWEIILKTNKPLTTRVEEVFLKTGVCYSINHHEIIICIKPINEDLLHEIIAIKPKKLFCLDRLFAGNDQWLTNLRLLCEDAGIDFEIPNR